MAHYRTFQNFTRDALSQAKKTRENLKKKIETLSSEQDSSFLKENDPDFIALASTFADDFNTPKFLSTLNSLLSKPNHQTKAIIKRFDENILKCDLFSAENKHTTKDIPDHITDLAHQRILAKQEKNYTLADQLRSDIQEAGFEIKDTPQGFEITKK